VRGKEGFSLGTCSARALQTSRIRVAYASQLYNYPLRFHLTIIVSRFLIRRLPLKFTTTLLYRVGFLAILYILVLGYNMP